MIELVEILSMERFRKLDKVIYKRVNKYFSIDNQIAPRKHIYLFNPDTHVVISKEQYQLLNQYQDILEMKKDLRIIKEYVDFTKNLNIKTASPRSKKTLSIDEKSAQRIGKLLKRKPLF